MEGTMIISCREWAGSINDQLTKLPLLKRVECFNMPDGLLAANPTRIMRKIFMSRRIVGEAIIERIIPRLGTNKTCRDPALANDLNAWARLIWDKAAVAERSFGLSA